jgi:hypothetical protein
VVLIFSVSATTPLSDNINPTYNFDFTIGEDYELNSTQVNALHHVLISDNSWGSWFRNSTDYKDTTSYGFKKHNKVIDIIFTAKYDNQDSPKFVARAYKPYNKSYVVELPCCNKNDNCTWVNTTINLNIHE